MTTEDARRGDHAELSPQEAADRLPIRELVDAYAYCADRRDATGQMGLFTEDADSLVYVPSRNPLRLLSNFADGMHSRRYSMNSTSTKPPCTSTVKALRCLRCERVESGCEALLHGE